jgi:hypothetical protein
MPSFAYVLLDARRRIGLRHTQFAAATCGTIRRKLLKIGAQVRLSVRRIKIAMASACPYQAEYHLAYLYLQLSKLVDELSGLLGQRTDVLLGPGRAGRAVEPIDRGLDLAQLRGRGVHPATSVADALLSS